MDSVDVLPQIDCKTDITRVNGILAAPLVVIITPVLHGYIIKLGRLKVRFCLGGLNFFGFLLPCRHHSFNASLILATGLPP